MASSEDQSENDLKKLRIEIVATENLHYLFSAALENVDDKVAETILMMRRLERQFQISPANWQFHVQKKPLSQSLFRLLTTRHIATIAQNFESYIAVSYCWASNEWSSVKDSRSTELTARESSIPLPVSLSMFEGVLAERTSENEGIWVDALCIDQENEVEKEHAISCMDIVYKSARLVIAILEDIEISRKEADILSDFIMHDDTEDGWRPSTENVRSLATILIRILSARWFTRAWCAHEFQLSKNFLFIVLAEGRVAKFNANTLINIYWHTKHILVWEEDLSSSMAAVSTAFDILSRASDIAKGTQVSTAAIVMPYMAMFRDVLSRNSSIEEDKISIAINLAGFQLDFVKRNRSMHECRWIAALLALAAGDATVLCGTGDSIQFKYQGSYGQSWLRWNDDLEDITITYGAPRLSGESHIAAINICYITLDLLFIKPFRPQTASPGSLSRAIAFIDHCLSYQDFLKEQNNDWMFLGASSDGYQEGRKLFIQILACSLDCGYTWMIYSGMTGELLTKGFQARVDRASFDLWPGIVEFLLEHAALQLMMDNARWRAGFIQYLYFIMDCFPIREQTGFYDGTRKHSIARLGIGAPGTAWQSITVDFASCESQYINDEKAIYAVPVALSESFHASLHRVWVLKPFNDDNQNSRWRLVNKLPLFSYADLEENGTSIRRDCNQKVYG